MGLCDESEENTASVTMDEESREVALFGIVTEEGASQVIQSIRHLGRSGKGNINLVICSGGGDESSGWAIYDALRLTKCKIVGYGIGRCMSIAALVLQGCDSRLLSENCRFMIHNGTLACGGPVEKVRVIVQESNFMTQRYYEALAERSNLTVDEVKKLCDDETYMGAEETVKCGFADCILGKTKQKAKKIAKKGK